MKWISVEDRLPDKCDYYIVYNGVSVRQGSFDVPSGAWFRFTKVDDVTHWMPLPEPPKD